MSENNGVADSWEAVADNDFISPPLSNLNVNAPEFVPSVNAPEFVPSYLKDSQPIAPDPPPVDQDMTLNSYTLNEDSKNMPSADCANVPADSWELAADDSTPSPTKESSSTPVTPDEDDLDDDESEKSKKERKHNRKLSDSGPVKEPVNVVFIGHVDAGKSTIGGQIMYLTGMVDKRTLEKYEREAREKNRETWYLSWALDTNSEERDKGKTVEVGRAFFETENKHFTILDAPGHKSFVPNMIGGTCQADLAVLVGFNPTRDIMFMPCSGLTGANLKDPIDTAVCCWFDGPAFIPYIDSLPAMKRNTSGPFMMPICERYNDRGTIVMGKVESGSCKKGDSLLLMPNKTPVVIDSLWRDDDETNIGQCGENVKVKLRGVEEADIAPGFVLCDPSNPCKTGRVFDGQVAILEHKSIICAGYSAVCHIHSVAEEVTVKLLICTIDKKTGEKSKTRPRFVKQDQSVIMRLETTGVICMEPFKDHPQLGRFTLRDEGKTIAIGKVLKIVE